jgi:hypothetical protein
MVLEFAALVVGVFIAVAAESWWSDREARAYEQSVRRDMVEDFEVNLRILDDDINTNDTVMADLRALGSMSLEELRGMSAPEARTRLSATAALGSAGFDPSMGAAQALVQSGNLGIVSDPRLRAQLAAWSALLQEKQRFSEQHTAFVLLQVVPRLAAMEADGAWSQEERVEAQALLTVKLNTVELIHRNQRALREVAESVLALLRPSSD